MIHNKLKGWFALRGVFARLCFFFTDSGSPWRADSEYALYIALWISLRGPILALKLTIWLNFDFSKIQTWSFLVSILGKSTSLIMKMILFFLPKYFVLLLYLFLRVLLIFKFRFLDMILRIFPFFLF